MSKKASSTMIGLFTLIGLLLAAAALVLFGAGKYFQQTHKIQLYFEKSVNGLQVGSDVRFGGVRVGRVSSINVIIDPAENRKIIPVVIELTAKDLKSVSGGESMIDFSSKPGVDRAVQQGLRAGMKQQSLVTGQLYIELDIVPDTPGFIFIETPEPLHPTIPTIPTEIDELISGITDGLKKINDLDIATLMNEVRDVLKSANTQISALNVREINENLTHITRDIRGLTSDPRVKSSLANLDQALLEINQLSAKANENIDPLLAEIRQVAAKAHESLTKIEAASEKLSNVSDPRAPQLLEFKNLLHEAETASRTLRELTSDLKRNPSTILRGKETE